MKTPQEKALKILTVLKNSGKTLEYIARSLADQDAGYQGPSVWSVQRWISGKVNISSSNVNRILRVYGTRK